MKRIDFIDVFKGIGIFFVILGHMPIKSELFSYVFSFQLSIFFFVGGFLYRDAHYINSFWDYVSKKFRSIIIPYIIFSIVSMIIYILYSDYLGKEYDILDIVWSILISKRNEIYINVPLWFLTSFFTVEILYYILKCFFNNYVISFIILVFGFIGVVIFRTTGSLNTLPFSFDASLYFIIYYFIGDLFGGINKYSNRDYKYFFRNLSPIFIVSIIVNVMNLLGKIKHADIIYYDFGFIIALISYLFHVFISLTGVCTYLYLSYIFRWVGIIKFVGRNSIYYFAFHMPLYQILYNEGIFDTLIGNYLTYDINLNLIGIIYSIIIILILTMPVLFINLYKSLIYKIKTSI
ncbi:Hypothetical protein SFBmNL_00274 [Candidatus Arthromitus sp. SFB-mouse-NL]|uniref:acyltransferase family protein n=1 Tax=Candidatus Arthromitus sp. SFB-mouse-NL TaxID=1508644 RepID=UPI00049AF713|nr:acyltransferase family protein [Candidatus Arthromitus sp. SFB-mouse-NL]AID44202.1 Hypothetical protein SFBmNL_00274 [Candidatus Arthromitus sp. SFB-mouse-NL]